MSKKERICKWCKSLFFVPASQLSHGRGVFCSRSCVAKQTTAIRKSQNGAANPNWKGGKKSCPKYNTTTKKAYRINNPEKYEAHKTMTNAIRRGDLKKEPCSVCGGEKVEGHHPDYAKPLEVIWLCKKHHMNIHRTGRLG